MSVGDERKAPLRNSTKTWRRDDLYVSEKKAKRCTESERIRRKQGNEHREIEEEKDKCVGSRAKLMKIIDGNFMESRPFMG